MGNNLDRDTYNCLSVPGSIFSEPESRREVITACYIASPDSEIEELKSIKALWDTGATMSCISGELAKYLNLANGLNVKLNITESQQEDVEKKTYIANLVLAASPEYIRFNNLRMIEISKHSRYDAIIGMDVIKDGDFALSQFNGQTVVTFRHPSQNEPLMFN